MIRRLLFLLLLAGPVCAQDPTVLADRAAAQLQDAARALASADGARDRVAALTDTIHAYEGGLQALREGLRRADARQGELRRRLTDEEAQLGQLLAALQTMSAAPEALLLLHPSGPVGTARAGMLMRDVTPAMLGRVALLRNDLTELATLQALQDSASDTLRDARIGVQTARTALSKAIQDRTDLPRRVAENEAQMQDLLASIDTLEGFADGLARLPPDPAGNDLPDFADATGQLALPVAGTLRLGWRAADAVGIRRPGWIVDTEPGALVTTPWPATIRYRGPLLDYGNVMILEPSADYLLVLAGLDLVYGAVGEVLPEGAPVGLMPGNEDEDEVPAGQLPVKTLYIELREGQEPVDPAAWFALDTE